VAAAALARAAPATFLAFDLLVSRGADLRNQPLTGRRQPQTAQVLPDGRLYASTVRPYR
jgi:ATP-dependent DNA ligase